jgi:hypothetical protein
LFIPPTKYIKAVIPAKAGIQAGTGGLRISERYMNFNSSATDLPFNCRVIAIMCAESALF